MNAVGNATHYVYRLYDNADRLIYVGCTYEPEARISRHRQTMWWAPQIHRIQIKAYPNRTAGLAAETEARNEEHPRWNIESRWMRRHTWTPQILADYITAMERHPTNQLAYRTERIAKGKAMLEARSIAA